MTTKPSDRSLEKLYSRLGSVPAVAAELGVAYETARRWLIDTGVELRGPGRPSAGAKGLDTRELARRYKRGESISRLGAEFGVSPATVRSRLIERGVELRPRPGWKY